jgi:hypothetical protein
VVIDHGNDSISIKSPEKIGSYSCVLANSVTVEAKSELMVKCSVEHSKLGENLLFEPRFRDDGVYWGHSVGVVGNENSFYVKVMNLRDKAVVFDQSTYVGDASTNFEIIEGSESIELKTVSVDSKKAASPRDPVMTDREKLNKHKFGRKLKKSRKLS